MLLLQMLTTPVHVHSSNQTACYHFHLYDPYRLILKGHFIFLKFSFLNSPLFVYYLTMRMDFVKECLECLCANI